MIAEVKQNRVLGDLLRGASIILAVEPPVQLPEALRRSKDAENIDESVHKEAIGLVARINHELGFNGDEPNRDRARKILDHMLCNPEWGHSSEKNELP